MLHLIFPFPYSETNTPQCDEGHPTCRNCQKSKRDCMGYDPIFKPQSGPPSIQSATQQYSPMSQPPPSSYPPSNSHTYSPAAYGAPLLDGDPPTSQPLDDLDPTLDHEEAESNEDVKQEQQGNDCVPEQISRLLTVFRHEDKNREPALHRRNRPSTTCTTLAITRGDKS